MTTRSKTTLITRMVTNLLVFMLVCTSFSRGEDVGRITLVRAGGVIWSSLTLSENLRKLKV
jgi:hypothetical protein